LVCRLVEEMLKLESLVLTNKRSSIFWTEGGAQQPKDAWIHSLQW
jgi:hypothetical protein